MVKSAADKARKAGADSPVIAAIEHSSRDAADYQPSKRKPRESRKRAADYFEGEASGDAEPSSKATKPKKKSKVEAPDEHKASREDGHLVDTAKTNPGGDMIEEEPGTAPKGKKGRGIKDKSTESSKPKGETQEVMSTEVAAMKKQFKKDGSAATTTNKTGNSKAAVKESKAGAKAGGQVEITRPKASKNQKVGGGNLDVSGSDQDMDQEPFETLLETKKVESLGKDLPTAKGAKKTDKVTAPKDNAGEALGKGGKALAPKGSGAKEHTETAMSISSSKATKLGEVAGVEQKKLGSAASKKDVMKSKQGNKAAKEGSSAEGTPPLDPVAIAARVFSEPVIAPVNPSKKEKILIEKTVIKDAKASAKPEPKNKRKASAVEGTDNLQSSSSVPELASTKKAKRSKKPGTIEAAGNKLEDLVSTGLEIAAEDANAAKGLLGRVARGVRKSLLGNATETTKIATESKKEKSKKEEKGKGKATDSMNGPIADSSMTLVPHASEEGAQNSSEEDEVEEEGDQTVALLKGFESVEDDDEEDTEGPSADQGFKAGQTVPALPDEKNLTHKLKRAKDDGDGPGVVYVGRIPHGFYEHEMRAYFTQFGPISRLRLSRNKSTGRSKHYAFIEFASTSVASIVAETMNNYLLFGHILKCKVVPQEQVHEDLWKGANKRFKKIPWSKIEGRKMELGAGRDVWEKRVENEKGRRAKKAEKLKEMGYEMPDTSLKAVKDVPVKKGKVIEEAVEVTEEKSLVVAAEEGTVVVSEEIKIKKSKKAKTGKEDESMDKKVRKSKRGTTAM